MSQHRDGRTPIAENAESRHRSGSRRVCIKAESRHGHQPASSHGRFGSPVHDRPGTLKVGSHVQCFSFTADAWVKAEVVDFPEINKIKVEYLAQDFWCRKTVHVHSENVVIPIQMEGVVPQAMVHSCALNMAPTGSGQLPKPCPKVNPKALPVPVLTKNTSDMEEGQIISMKEDDPYRMSETPPLPSFISTDDPTDRHCHVVKHELDVRGLELEKDMSPYQGEMIKTHTFAWVFDNVLSKEQCLSLIETANCKGFTPALQGTSFKTKEKAGGDNLIFNPKFRSVYTVMYDAPEVTGWLFKALEPHLNGMPVPQGWRVDHLNAFTRTLCYCHAGQVHNPHFDAMMKYPKFKYPDDHEYSKARSYMTIMIYLNDVPTEAGGWTAFPIPNSEEREGDPRCLPKAGRVLIFSQNLYHAGSPMKDDHMKYVFRSDVMCLPEA